MKVFWIVGTVLALSGVDALADGHARRGARRPARPHGRPLSEPVFEYWLGTSRGAPAIFIRNLSTRGLECNWSVATRRADLPADRRHTTARGTRGPIPAARANQTDAEPVVIPARDGGPTATASHPDVDCHDTLGNTYAGRLTTPG